MSDDIFRAAVKKMYPNSTGWEQRVDRMSDRQVHAIYSRNTQPKRRVVIEIGEPAPGYRQGTLFKEKHETNSGSGLQKDRPNWPSRR